MATEDVTLLSRIFRLPPQELGWLECLWSGGGQPDASQPLHAPNTTLLQQQMQEWRDEGGEALLLKKTLHLVECLLEESCRVEVKAVRQVDAAGARAGELSSSASASRLRCHALFFLAAKASILASLSLEDIETLPWRFQRVLLLGRMMTSEADFRVHAVDLCRWSVRGVANGISLPFLVQPYLSDGAWLTDFESFQNCMHQDVLDGGSPQPLFPPAPGEELRGTGSQHMHHLVISTSSKGVSGVKPALVQWGSVDISEQLELEATTQEYEHKCASYLEEAVHHADTFHLGLPVIGSICRDLGVFWMYRENGETSKASYFLNLCQTVTSQLPKESSLAPAAIREGVEPLLAVLECDTPSSADTVTCPLDDLPIEDIVAGDKMPGIDCRKYATQLAQRGLADRLVHLLVIDALHQNISASLATHLLSSGAPAQASSEDRHRFLACLELRACFSGDSATSTTRVLPCSVGFLRACIAVASLLLQHTTSSYGGGKACSLTERTVHQAVREFVLHQVERCSSSEGWGCLLTAGEPFTIVEEDVQQYHQSVLRRADEEGGSSRTQALSSFLHENDLLAAAVDAREDPEFSSLVASQFGGLLEFSASTLAGTSSSPAGSVLSAQVSQLASLHFSLENFATSREFFSSQLDSLEGSASLQYDVVLCSLSLLLERKYSRVQSPQISLLDPAFAEELETSLLGLLSLLEKADAPLHSKYLPTVSALVNLNASAAARFCGRATQWIDKRMTDPGLISSLRVSLRHCRDFLKAMEGLSEILLAVPIPKRSSQSQVDILRQKLKHYGLQASQHIMDWASAFVASGDSLEQEMSVLLHSWHDFPSLELFASVVGNLIFTNRSSESIPLATATICRVTEFLQPLPKMAPSPEVAAALQLGGEETARKSVWRLLWRVFECCCHRLSILSPSRLASLTWTRSLADCLFERKAYRDACRMLLECCSLHTKGFSHEDGLEELDPVLVDRLVLCLRECCAPFAAALACQLKKSKDPLAQAFQLVRQTKSHFDTSLFDFLWETSLQEIVYATISDRSGEDSAAAGFLLSVVSNPVCNPHNSPSMRSKFLGRLKLRFLSHLHHKLVDEV